jgi:hypothetical protein
LEQYPGVNIEKGNPFRKKNYWAPLLVKREQSHTHILTAQPKATELSRLVLDCLVNREKRLFEPSPNDPRVSGFTNALHCADRLPLKPDICFENIR